MRLDILELLPCMIFRTVTRAAIVLAGLLLTPLGAQEPAPWRDRSPHGVQFVAVDRNVRLEVLDWGGVGRPLVLLSGLGNTAHVFDEFAPKLAVGFHVYGVTRRGFGASSIPTDGYNADRLGDDVLAVVESLKLKQPILAGHSVAGEELSSVGSRHPDRVAGLVYLEAGYSFAFDDGRGMTLEQYQEMLKRAPPLPEMKTSDRANFADFQAWMKRIGSVTIPEAELRESWIPAADGSVSGPRSPASVSEAIMAGYKKFVNVRAPALAIFAVPRDLGPWLFSNSDPASHAATKAFSADFDDKMEQQAKAFEHGVLGARVVRLRNANHYVFLSNEAEVLQEMRAFAAALR
jgi:non-heme chloroperoxidase